MSRILVGSTIPAFAMTAEEPHWQHWLENAEDITRAAHDAGHEVEWLAVLQTDARGLEPFGLLLDRLAELGGDHWTFSVNTGETAVTSGSRLIAICTGRNLIVERANRNGHDWIYFADSDISAPDDVLPRLLEVGWPVVGGHVPTYGLDGPRVSELPTTGGWIAFPAGADCRQHWNTAGSLLVAREVFLRVPWRYDLSAGLTDDPATQAEMERLGWPTVVRHDVICRHNPEAIGPLERRRVDRKVYA